jgi:PIN domain nuclease of toxin-antitoxin system
MKILLDTHSVLWFLGDAGKLSEAAFSAIIEPSNEKYVSIATVWELAIKISLDKLHFDGGVEDFVKVITENGFLMLGIHPKHLKAVETLPFHHRDPFDRLLVAAALSESMPIITADKNIRVYGAYCIW